MIEVTPDSSGDPRGPALQPGRTTFDLPLGPLRVRVVDLPTSWSFVAENYDPFAEPPSSASPDLVVHCREGEGVVVPLPPIGGGTIIELERAGALHRIRSHWQDGTIDIATRRGEIVLTDRRNIPFRMSLENYLRVACQLLLVERRGFLIHGAGILDHERCFVLFGPSGAGKSTATEFSAPRAALSDDLVLIDVSEDRPTAHAVPFFGAFPPRQRVRGCWPVAAALRLRQSPDDRLSPVSMAQAVATVSASVPFVHELGQRHEGLTGVVAEFCAKVPVCDLFFTRGASFWPLLLERFPA